ncbi:MAG: hypothetical protein WAS24_01900 [Thermoplasmata archaeon]|jgi:hypothetical protein
MNLSPQHASYCAHWTDNRIKRSKRWDNDEGVAATIGTIMSLLVFLTAFGIFTNQFVPVWMSDNESMHMSQALQQFTTVKSSIDIAISNNANSRIAPTPVFVPVTLSSSGIPVFAAATAGILIFTPSGVNTRPSFNVTYAYVAGGIRNQLSPANDGKSGGDLDLWCPNRYFVEQHLIYENGAVILNQSDGEFILAGPQFLVKDIGTSGTPNRVLQITQITLLGSNVTIGGTGSKGVTANLKYADTKTYENASGSTMTIQIVSKHGMAWSRYFNSTLNGTAGMTFKKGYNITTTLKSFPDKTRNYYIVTITIDRIMIVDHTKATVALTIGELGL